MLRLHLLAQIFDLHFSVSEYWSKLLPNPPVRLSWNILQCVHTLQLTPPVAITSTFSIVAFLIPPLALAEINRRYLTLMWGHYVSCSVETTFVSATGLFALVNCALLSCKAAWRYSCCKEGSEVSGRGATRATWKYKECVVPVCDTFSGPYD